MGRESYVARGNKPYQQYFFRCIVPNDLREHFNQKELRISLKSSQYSLSKILSRKLWDLSQFIYREVREGYIKVITLEEVKNILRIEVRKSLFHIHHYELGTNVFDEDKLKESISRVDKDEEKLKERLKKDYKGTIDKIENEIDKILVSQNLKNKASRPNLDPPLVGSLKFPPFENSLAPQKGTTGLNHSPLTSSVLLLYAF